MSDTDSKDLSFLYPHLFAVDQTVGDVNADLTRILRVVDHAIAQAEKHAPDLPELTLLRARRTELRRLQHGLFGVSEHLQTELFSMEAGYAERSGIGDWR